MSTLHQIGRVMLFCGGTTEVVDYVGGLGRMETVQVGTVCAYGFGHLRGLREIPASGHAGAVAQQRTAPPPPETLPRDRGHGQNTV